MTTQTRGSPRQALRAIAFIKAQSGMPVRRAESFTPQILAAPLVGDIDGGGSL